MAKPGGRMAVRLWRLATVAALPWLVACVPPDYPEDPFRREPDAPQSPEIAPLSPLLGAERTLPDATDPDPELRQRGEALERAASAQPPSEASDLADRGEALRRRADAVRGAAEP